jgi:FMN reductase
MARQISIIGIGGSLEEHSYSLHVLEYTISELSRLGARTKIIDIKNYKNLPLYDFSGAEKQIPYTDFLRVIGEIHKSDGVIFSSPEYHGTVSAAFKNFIDYFELLKYGDPPYLTGKPIGSISVGGGDNSGLFTLNTLINIAHSLRGITISGNVAIPNIKQAFDEHGNLSDDVVKRRLNRLSEEIYFVASKLAE